MQLRRQKKKKEMLREPCGQFALRVFYLGSESSCTLLCAVTGDEEMVKNNNKGESCGPVANQPHAWVIDHQAVQSASLNRKHRLELGGAGRGGREGIANYCRYFQRHHSIAAAAEPGSMVPLVTLTAKQKKRNLMK